MEGTSEVAAVREALDAVAAEVAPDGRRPSGAPADQAGDHPLRARAEAASDGGAPGRLLGRGVPGAQGQARRGSPRYPQGHGFIAAINAKASRPTPRGTVYACRVVAAARPAFAGLGAAEG